MRNQSMQGLGRPENGAECAHELNGSSNAAGYAREESARGRMSLAEPRYLVCPRIACVRISINPRQLLNCST
jgi:hypothetical protein